MDHENKIRDNAKNHHSVLASEEDSIHEEPEKIGWLRKLLDWISKGAAKSNAGTMGCPT